MCYFSHAILCITKRVTYFHTEIFNAINRFNPCGQKLMTPIARYLQTYRYKLRAVIAFFAGYSISFIILVLFVLILHT